MIEEELEKNLTASMVLASAREEMGLSQQEAARTLYLTPAFIRYIDSDEMDKIAKQAFIKGYLRSYAKLVNLDPYAVIALYEEEGGAQESEDEPLRSINHDDNIVKLSFTGPVFISGLLGMLALLLVVVLVWLFSTPAEDTPLPVLLEENNPAQDSGDVYNAESAEYGTESYVQSNTESTIGGDAPSEIEGSQEGSQEDHQDIPLETPIERMDPAPILETPASETSVDQIQQSQEIVNPAVSETEFQARPVVVGAEGSDELKFTLAGECWLQVEDSEGNIIYSDLGRAGNDITLTGQAPFKLLVGKADAVSILFNGEAVELKSYTRSTGVAKLSIGSER